MLCAIKGRQEFFLSMPIARASVARITRAIPRSASAASRDRQANFFCNQNLAMGHIYEPWQNMFAPKKASLIVF